MKDRPEPFSVLAPGRENMNGLEICSKEEQDSLGDGEKEENPWIFSDSKFLPITCIFVGKGKINWKGKVSDVYAFRWLNHEKVASEWGCDDSDLTTFYGKRSQWQGKHVRIIGGKKGDKLILQHVEEDVN